MKISDRKMSVVIVIADAFGAMHSSIAGYERDTTPFIKDFFSKGSLIYANARSNAPWTLPSFASFLRSRLPREIITKELFSDEGALPKILYEHDIPVISFLRKPTFTIFESIANAFESSNRSFFDYKNYEDPFDVAVENINNSKKPSLFFIHDTTPHSPYIPPEAYRTLFGGKGNELDQGPIPDRNYLVNLHNTYVPHEEKERLRLLYDQKLRYLDDLFKAFILNLSPDVLEKTVVIFAADHGESFGEHRNSFHHGLTLYDELLRIPLYVKIPGQLQQTIQQPVSMLDLAPTILNFFNIPVPASYKGAVLPTENISGIQRRNVQCDGGKVLSFNVRGLLSKIPTENLTRPIINPLPSVAIIEDDLKLYVSKGFKEEVYDLIKDPFETNDLFISNPSKARGFAHKHLEKIASTTISLHYLNRINLDNTWQVRMYARDSEMAQLEWRDIIGKKFLDSQRKHHQMILLVEKYPYFLTAYIEILEFLYKHNPKWHTAFLTYTNDRLRRFLFGNNFGKLFSLYSLTDIIVVRILLHYLLTQKEINFWDRQHLKLLAKSIDIYISQNYHISQQNNVLIKNTMSLGVRSRPMKHILGASLEVHWYKDVDSFFSKTDSRQYQKIHLRLTSNPEEKPRAVDGTHESFRTEQASFFYYITGLIEYFAVKHKLGLGNVTLNRYPPHSIATFESAQDTYAKNRLRYHLILYASKIGAYTRCRHEGDVLHTNDLLLIQNMENHTIYNLSNEWCYDIIFDAYKLDKNQKNLSTDVIQGE